MVSPEVDPASGQGDIDMDLVGISLRDPSNDFSPAQCERVLEEKIKWLQQLIATTPAGRYRNLLSQSLKDLQEEKQDLEEDLQEEERDLEEYQMDAAMAVAETVEEGSAQEGSAQEGSARVQKRGFLFHLRRGLGRRI